MQITVLAGGIGGAKFLRGVRAASPGDRITAIVNTGDDVTLHGLRICPDLDSVMYTLGGGSDNERGWGRADESWRIKNELAEYGAEPSWFGLGDLDIATHLVRTRMLDAGYPLSDVTAALCQRWKLNGDMVLLPMTDQRCETHVVVDLPDVDAESGSRRHAIHFQEWWIKHHAALPAHAFVQVGLEQALPAPGVLAAISGADLILFAPSNPVVSIGTIIAVPGIREALVESSAPIVGLSPIINNAPIRGMADACLKAIGVPVSAEAVAAHYGARSAGGLLDAWLIDATDTAVLPGIEVRAIPLLMTDDQATAAMVRTALEFCR